MVSEWVKVVVVCRLGENGRGRPCKERNDAFPTASPLEPGASPGRPHPGIFSLSGGASVGQVEDEGVSPGDGKVKIGT